MQNAERDNILASAAVAPLDDGRDRYLGSGSHLWLSFLFHVTILTFLRLDVIGALV